MSWYDRLLCWLARRLHRRISRRFDLGRDRVFWLRVTTHKPVVSPINGLFVEPLGRVEIAFGTPGNQRVIAHMTMTKEMMEMHGASLGEVLDVQEEQYAAALGMSVEQLFGEDEDG